MRFSGFAPFGLDSFSSRVPLAKRLFDTLWANLNGSGKATNFARGGYSEAKVFATAMALARWLLLAQRLQEEVDPERVLFLLEAREEEFGVVPPLRATIAERRAALQVQMRLGLGGSYGTLRQALEDTLGVDFVELRQLDPGDTVNVPDDPSTGPGLFTEPVGPRYYYRLRNNLSVLGLRSVVIEHLDGSTPTDEQVPQPGEFLVVEPEHNVLRERVEVLAAGPVGDTGYLLATFTKPHHAGAILTTQPWPYWASNRRHWVVRLTPSAALDAETRRRTHELMGKLVRGVSTWNVVGSDGPFLLGTSPLGATPFASAP